MVQQFLTEMGIHKFALETSSRKSGFETTTPTPKNNILKQSEPENVSRSKAVCLIFFSCYEDYLEEQKRCLNFDYCFFQDLTLSQHFPEVNSIKDVEAFPTAITTSMSDLPPPPPYDAINLRTYESSQYYSPKSSSFQQQLLDSPKATNLLKAQRPFAHQTSANHCPTTIQPTTHFSQSSAGNQSEPSPSFHQQLLDSPNFESENGCQSPGNDPPIFSNILDYDLFSGKPQEPIDFSHPPPYFTSPKIVDLHLQQHQQFEVNSPHHSPSTATVAAATSQLTFSNHDLISPDNHQPVNPPPPYNPDFLQQAFQEINQNIFQSFHEGSFSPSVTPTTGISQTIQ